MFETRGMRVGEAPTWVLEQHTETSPDVLDELERRGHDVTAQRAAMRAEQEFWAQQDVAGWEPPPVEHWHDRADDNQRTPCPVADCRWDEEV
jgi:hypothetical protein